MPACVKVYVYVAPEARELLPNRLAVSEVKLCGSLVAFDHVTVSPVFTVRVSGLNPFAVMLMLSGAGGV